MNKNKSNLIIIITIFVICVVIWYLLPCYFLWHGKNLLKKQDYIKALNNIKIAHILDNTNTDIRYYYVEALSKVNPDVNVQKEVFAIASGNSDDSAKSLANTLVNRWKNNILKNIGDNYIEQTPMNKSIIRWDTSKFPLKIAILDESGTNIPEYYNTEILKAFNQWHSSVPFITFKSVDNSNDTDILVRIKPLPSDICQDNVCKYVVGFTTPEYKRNLLKRMTVVLYSKDPYGNYFSDKELYNTILHEIGHALGIMGHSYSSEDLMYMSNENNNFYSPYRSSFQYLSSKDINTIKLLYKLVPTVSNTHNINLKGLIYPPIILGSPKDMAMRKLKEAQMYIKNAPDLSGGYIDLGTAYADLEKYKEAVKHFKKAYELSKTANEKYIALFNVANVYTQAGKYEKALDYAKQAQNINDDEEIRELIANITFLKSKKN